MRQSENFTRMTCTWQLAHKWTFTKSNRWTESEQTLQYRMHFKLRRMTTMLLLLWVMLWGTKHSVYRFNFDARWTTLRRSNGKNALRMRHELQRSVASQFQVADWRNQWAFIRGTTQNTLRFLLSLRKTSIFFFSILFLLLFILGRCRRWFNYVESHVNTLNWTAVEHNERETWNKHNKYQQIKWQELNSSFAKPKQKQEFNRAQTN